MLDVSQIQLYLFEKGIKPSNSGFRYLVECAEIISEQQKRHLNLNKLYASVAKEYGRSPLSIERAIRYALKHRSQSNKEFIYDLARDLECKSEDKVVNL